jgi:hypothetical protein
LFAAGGTAVSLAEVRVTRSQLGSNDPGDRVRTLAPRTPGSRRPGAARRPSSSSPRSMREPFASGVRAGSTRHQSRTPGRLRRWLGRIYAVREGQPKGCPSRRAWAMREVRPPSHASRLSRGYSPSRPGPPSSSQNLATCGKFTVDRSEQHKMRLADGATYSSPRVTGRLRDSDCRAMTPLLALVAGFLVVEVTARANLRAGLGTRPTAEQEVLRRGGLAYGVRWRPTPTPSRKSVSLAGTFHNWPSKQALRGARSWGRPVRTLP